MCALGKNIYDLIQQDAVEMIEESIFLLLQQSELFLKAISFCIQTQTHAHTYIHTARFVLNSFVPFQQVFLIIKRKITCALMEKNLALIHLPPLLFTYA